MVADIGYRYISEGAKGSALEHKKIGRLIANGDQSSSPRAPVAPPRHPRSTLPPPIYGAFCTFDIFYCRSPLFVLFMFLLGPAVTPRSPWLGRRPPRKYFVHSRAKFTSSPCTVGHWILRRICSWCKHAAILKRYISPMPYHKMHDR